MRSKLPARKDPAAGLLIGYSTNVHPGEDLREIYRSLRSYTIPIGHRVFGRRPRGLELRVGMGAARDLLRTGAREKFRDFLDKNGLRLFSINAFPLGNFHAHRVKEGAYRPPWTHPRRALWTRKIARIFSDLLEPELVGSLSTLAGTYRAWGESPAVKRRMALGYLEALEELRDIEEESGKRIVLAAEPEPDTTFETAADVISFFQEYLLPAARGRWSGKVPRGRVEEILRRYFTVNFDTCHLSTVFRRPLRELKSLARAGISIGKVHVTSALALRDPLERPGAYEQLRAISEPRYLHQVRGADRRGSVISSWRDLDELPPLMDLASSFRPSARTAGRFPRLYELRSHFHVPVNSERWRLLSTTREETREAVLWTLKKKLCNQLVVETYTWPLLGPGKKALGREALIAGIAREFRWLLEVISGRARNSEL